MTTLARPRPIVLRIISAPPGEISPQPLRLTGGRATIGRRDGSSWVLPDASAGVSREHAVIEETHDGWQIVDLSANGTFVNGQNVGNGNAWPLRTGDSICIGGYQIAVELEDVPNPSAEPPATADDPFDLGDLARPDFSAPPTPRPLSPTTLGHPPQLPASNDVFGDFGDDHVLPGASPFDAQQPNASPFGAPHPEDWDGPVGRTDPLALPQQAERSASSDAQDPLASPPDPFDQPPLAPWRTEPPPAELDPIEAALASLGRQTGATRITASDPGTDPSSNVQPQPAPRPTASRPPPQASPPHPPPPQPAGTIYGWMGDSSSQQMPASVPLPTPPAPTTIQVGAAPRHRRSWWQAALSVLRPARNPRQPDAAPPAGGAVDGRGDTVVSVFAPSRIAAGDTAMVQVFLHLQEQAGIAMETAAAFDDDATRRAARTLAATIPVGTPVQIALTIPGLAPSPAFDVIVWNRRPESAQFSVAVPASRAPEIAVGVVRLWVGGVPIGELRFKIAITAAARAGAATPAEVDARRYHRAFASYASPDRAEVLRRVQMLRRVGVEVFQDVLDLEPGQRWERELYRHIDECDVVLLFWSTAARDSVWVAREIDYAMARQRRERIDDGSPDMPAIEPLPIEGPPIPPPPDKLRHLHFNDALLYAIAGEDRARGR